MNDFNEQTRFPSAPAANAAAVIPDNDTALPEMTRALYVARAGHVAVEMASGTYVTFEDVPAGSVLPCRVLRVLAGGTTASGIIALW